MYFYKQHAKLRLEITLFGHVVVPKSANTLKSVIREKLIVFWLNSTISNVIVSKKYMF